MNIIQTYLANFSPFRHAIPNFECQFTMTFTHCLVPDEILIEIFSYLNPLELTLINSTCKRFYRLSRDRSLDRIWEKIDWDAFSNSYKIGFDPNAFVADKKQKEHIINHLAAPCPFTKGKRVYETHTLMRTGGERSVFFSLDMKGSSFTKLINEKQPFSYVLIPDIGIAQTVRPRFYVPIELSKAYWYVGILKNHCNLKKMYRNHKEFKDPDSVPVIPISCFDVKTKIQVTILNTFKSHPAMSKIRKDEKCSLTKPICIFPPEYGFDGQFERSFFVQTEDLHSDLASHPDFIEAIKNVSLYYMRII